MKFAPPQTAIFLDLETNGLYPRGPGAAILEIGMLAVEVPSFREIDSWSSLVVELGQLSDVLVGCDDYVRDMHTKNGLKADLEAAVAASKRAGSNHNLPRLFDVQQAAIQFYNKHASGKRVYLAGAKPDFDRGWMDLHMAALAKKFHYRGFDTNAFFILKEYMFGKEKSGQSRRVLDDCRQAVKVVHDHFDLMKQVFNRPDPRVLSLLKQARQTLWGAPGGHQGLIEDLGDLIEQLEPPTAAAT